MGKQLVVFFDPNLQRNKNFFKYILSSKSSAMSAILFQSESSYRINFSGPKPQIIKIKKESKIDPMSVAKSLRADLVGNLNVIDGVNLKDMTLSMADRTSFSQEESQLVFRNNNLTLFIPCEHLLKVGESDTQNILWERT